MIYKHVVTSTSGENTLHGTKAQHILTLSFQFLPFFSPFIILFPLQVPLQVPYAADDENLH